MATDQGPVVGSAILRAELVRLRRDRGQTQEEVARRLEWSPSKLIRIEGGRSGLTKVDLDALLSVYEATSARERLQQLNRVARERGWWDAYKNDFNAEYLSFIGYEAGASFVRQTAMMIPGLLQTPEYAEALATDQADPDKINAVVSLRLQRQRELAQRTDPVPVLRAGRGSYPPPCRDQNRPGDHAQPAEGNRGSSGTRRPDDDPNHPLRSGRALGTARRVYSPRIRGEPA